MSRPVAPPSGLTAISPSSGEIRHVAGGACPACFLVLGIAASVVGYETDESVISPIEGEMPGRAEGGNIERMPRRLHS